MASKPGVYTARKKNGTLYYRSSITYRGKHISLGSYPAEASAHHAYLCAAELLASTETPEDYHKDCVLAFDKWISLINFRDHQVYIKNPIYLRRHYFEYYLNRDLVLKFDIEDLFYYSEHKISIRGGHLFVADYGMQISIAGRYGIKAYAVRDRDYRFINHDPTDYRYENIEIINRYHGVSRIERKGKVLHKATIHIENNYVIGYYETDVQAAIAYNKAIDHLRKAGLAHNHVPNYIDSLSPSSYAEFYSKIKLPQKLLQL